MNLRLGKRAPRPHPNTLKLFHFFKDDLPEPARRVYREYKTPPEAMRMFQNDKHGCCVFVTIANKIIHDTVHTSSVVIPTDKDVLDAYSAVTGFNPETGAHDDGTVMVEALEYMREVGMCGHKILAWAQIDHRNLKHRRLGVQMFGATLMGAQMPNSALDQFDAGQSFHLVQRNSGMAGGHAMLHPGYGAEGGSYVTWAKWDQKANLIWEAHYVDEEYIVITEDWFVKATQKTPGGSRSSWIGESDLGTATLKMLFSEQHILPVVQLEPNQDARLDTVNIVKDRKVHIAYRWREGGIDHSLYLVLNTCTLLPEDIEASILLEPLSLGL